MKFHKRLFFLIIFLIPVNLGKHYIFRWSYVHGRLIDYLIPTVYVTDILIAVLLIWWVWASLKKHKSIARHVLTLIAKHKPLQFYVIFLFTLLLSVFSSLRYYPAAYSFLRLFLYTGLLFYTLVELEFKKDFPIICRVFSIAGILLSILAFLQWYVQGSFFDNYLFFGEQPYSSSTWGVVKESFFGFSRIPSYGTFRHPNVFAAYLGYNIILMWYFFTHTAQKFWRILSFVSFTLSLVSLFLTFSTISLAVFLFLWLLFVLYKGYERNVLYLSVFVLAVTFCVSLLLPVFSRYDFLIASTSFSRRYDLYLAAWEMILRKPLFGVGMNNSLVLVEDMLIVLGKARFVQPVHNVFLLIFSESGVFAVLFFSLFILSILRKTIQHLLASQKNRKIRDDLSFCLYLLLLAIMILSFYDHFFWTIHQTQLLLILTLSFLLKYNFIDEE